MPINNMDWSLGICFLNSKIHKGVCFEVLVDVSENKKLGAKFVQEYLELPKVPEVGQTIVPGLAVERSVAIEYNPLHVIAREIVQEPLVNIRLVLKVLVVKEEIQVNLNKVDILQVKRVVVVSPVNSVPTAWHFEPVLQHGTIVNLLVVPP